MTISAANAFSNILKKRKQTANLIKIASALADHTESQKNDIITQIRTNLKALSSPVDRVNRVMSQMTQEGQAKVADYAADILPRYRAKDAPQNPTEDNNTPSPGTVPESK